MTLLNKSAAFFAFFLVAKGISLSAQNLILPLGTEVSLAGNYGELRKNHFHMGLDFRTNSKENYPVYAVADGYISRVLVSPNGYGKCIYINHPELGITSVYAHLNSFFSEIEAWTDRTQYAIQKNSLDTLLPINLIPISKGDQIALSGNTGSSSGPHLHFEIRNMSTEKTINPLHFYPQIRDNQSPKIGNLALYSIGETSSNFIQSIQGKNQEYSVSAPNIGLAVSTFDQMNSGTNVMGIYKIKLYENGKWRYTLEFDSLDFSWQSHIKAVSDYTLPYGDVYKLYYESCGFNLSNPNAQNGILNFIPEEEKDIRIETYDYHENKTVVNFRLKYLPTQNSRGERLSKKLDCSIENRLEFKDLKLLFPKNCMASAEPMSYSFLPKSKPNELVNLRLFYESKPVLIPYQFTYIADKFQTNRSKLYLYSKVDGKHKTYIGVWNENLLTFKVKNFGLLSLRFDMNKPTLSAPTKSAWSIIYQIGDEESGIGSYNLYIDDKWRKIYYDEKSKRLIYKILSEDKGKKSNLRLEVEDKVGNKNILTKEIFF